MPKKKKTKTRSIKKGEHYAVSGGKAERKKQPCPKCGPGISMAVHNNRLHCGKCGYTMMKGVKPAEEKPAEAELKEKPVETKPEEKPAEPENPQ